MFDFCVILITSILTWLLIAQAIMSWFVNPYGRSGYGRSGPADFFASLYRGLSSFTYPLTVPARSLLSRFNTGPVDFSLLLTVLFLIAAREILIRIF